MTIHGGAARAFAAVKRFMTAPAWSDRGGNMDADRNRAQLEAERLNVHRDSGRFGGAGPGI